MVFDLIKNTLRFGDGDGDGSNLCRVKKVDVSSTFIEILFLSVFETVFVTDL